MSIEEKTDDDLCFNCGCDCTCIDDLECEEEDGGCDCGCTRWG